jgi:hypothetical protein
MLSRPFATRSTKTFGGAPRNDQVMSAGIATSSLYIAEKQLELSRSIFCQIPALSHSWPIREQPSAC